MVYQFSHIGVPVDYDQPRENEIFMDEFNIYRVDSSNSCHHFEYIRFMKDSIFPQIVRETVHIGYDVGDIRQAVADADAVVFSIYDLGIKKIAFVLRDGVLIELIQNT